MKSDYKMMTKFKNQHNEEFTLLFNENIVMVRGDEVGTQEISLFNEQFNVYTKDELAQIGKALQKWAEV